jgi:hypothetical protein
MVETDLPRWSVRAKSLPIPSHGGQPEESTTPSTDDNYPAMGFALQLPLANPLHPEVVDGMVSLEINF